MVKARVCEAKILRAAGENFEKLPFPKLKIVPKTSFCHILVSNRVLPTYQPAGAEGAGAFLKPRCRTTGPPVGGRFLVI